MRKITVLIAAALVLSLTACSQNNESSPADNSLIDSTNNSRDSKHDPQQTSYDSTPLPFTLFGADNVGINFGDVTSISDINGDPVSREMLGDTNWNEIVCDGFAYIAEHPEVILNSVDDHERYDSETMSFADVPDYSDIEYKRRNVGDKLGELTLKSAKTTFSRFGYEDKSGPLTEEQIKAEGLPFAGMLRRCEASFDGEITMTGYVRVNVDEYGVEEGEVILAPTEDCPLPVINFHVDSETDKMVSPLWTQVTNGFSYVSEYPIIRLGNIYKNADLSGFPTDGTSVKAQVTVTDVTMFSDTAMSSFIDCKLVSIKKM